MPTVLRLSSFRFHFYSDEGNEPPHIHVATPEGECKFWLDPVRLARNKGVGHLKGQACKIATWRSSRTP